jgi:UDP-N-acetylmuramoyl-L-alanyl-D-glutamate--2,6-diaminopimelate ligase
MSDPIVHQKEPVVGLFQLCRGIVEIPETVNPDLAITGIASDSRQVKPGNCFVAIAGYRTDGHVYIDEAVNRGASCLIVENEVGQKDIPVLHVENTRLVLAVLSGRYFGNPAEKIKLIGITGTNGKSTTAFLIESICQTAGEKTGLIGTMIYRWNEHEIQAERTTPESIDIQRMFWEMRNHGIETVVMEVSSHALMLDRVFGLNFRAAVFTNLSRDHMNFHKTPENYENAKAKLFKMIGEEGIGVLNGDDPAAERIRKQATGKTVFYGKENPNADYLIRDIRKDGQKTHFSLYCQDQKIDLTTRLWGHFNVMNTAAAAVTGLELNLDHDAIRRGIEKVESIKGRMEGFIAPDGIRVIIDYAHTPDALKNVLIAAREITEKRMIVVFGCGGDRDRGKRAQMGQIGSAFADAVFVTSDNPRSEDPKAIIKDILEGIPSDQKTTVIENRREAIRRALSQAKAGDTVVLAGKGHETYQQIGSEKFPFDDRIVAEECLGVRNEK